MRHGCVFPFCTVFPAYTGVAVCRCPVSKGFVISEGIEPCYADYLEKLENVAVRCVAHLVVRDVKF
jgi:hypothetical protein